MHNTLGAAIYTVVLVVHQIITKEMKWLGQLKVLMHIQCSTRLVMRPTTLAILALQSLCSSSIASPSPLRIPLLLLSMIVVQAVVLAPTIKRIGGAPSRNASRVRGSNLLRFFFRRHKLFTHLWPRSHPRSYTQLFIRRGMVSYSYDFPRCSYPQS